MYSSKPAIVYGFHGLDETIGIEILNQKQEFYHSDNSYDGLGKGVYFWENNHRRAKEYALLDSKRSESNIKSPFVLGAVIELGNCLDLLDQEYNNFLKKAYDLFKTDMLDQGRNLPLNGTFGASDFDFKKRELDCAVIRFACTLAEKAGQPFDSVRAAFIEGQQLYDGAKFYSQNHIQLAIINPDCIKGIFLPRAKFDKP